LLWRKSHRKLSSIAISDERKNFAGIAQNHYKALFRKILLGFITEQNPLLAILG